MWFFTLYALVEPERSEWWNAALDEEKKKAEDLKQFSIWGVQPTVL